MVGLDFSLKNGDPGFPDSLHCIGNQKNPYEEALSQILSVLLPFDFDKSVAVYGFGAIPHFANLRSGEVSNW
jgi:hypothetical protein